MPVPLTIAGWSPGPWYITQLLICHHWTQFQSSEPERSCITLLKLESATTKAWHLLDPKRNSHSLPPLSHRGVITPVIWGYRPSFTTLTQHIRPVLRCTSRCKVGASGHSTQHIPRGMQSCMKLSPGMADQCHSKEKYKIQHFYLGPAQFLRSENRFFFFFLRSTKTLLQWFLLKCRFICSGVFWGEYVFSFNSQNYKISQLGRGPSLGPSNHWVHVSPRTN